MKQGTHFSRNEEITHQGGKVVMFKKTVLFVFAMLFFVNAAFAAVNINKADKAALEALPGIGSSKAAAIIEYRTKNGNFKTKEGLLEVKGIGPKILESIQKDIEL